MSDANGSGRLPLRLGNLRDPIEAGFGRFGHWIYRRAWLVILVMVGFVSVLTMWLPSMVIDTSTEGLLPSDHPIRVAYGEFRDRYGRDQAVLISVEADDVFDLDFLARLADLHAALEQAVPHLQDVTSLINTRNTRGDGDELIVQDLLEDWPESEADLAVLRERVRSNPLYVDQLISRDERVTTILVKPNVYSSLGHGGDALTGFDEDTSTGGGGDVSPAYLTGEENTELVLAVEAIAARFDREGFQVRTAGVPIMVDRIMRSMMSDMARFTQMALATIAICLALLFRRLAAVVLPLMVSGLSMVATVSLMAILEIPLTTTSQIMPSFLLAVGVGSAVHIIAIFYQGQAKGQSKEDAIAYALSHSGLAVAMTCFTTAGGMLSFLSADIAPIVELGLITAIGIMMSLLFTVVLLPAMLAVMPMRQSQKADPKAVSPTRAFLIRIGDMATRRAWAVVGVSALVLVIAVAGITRLRLSHDPVGWFPEDDPLRVAMEQMDEDLNGTMFIEMLIDTGTENGILLPDTLDKMEAIDSFARAQETESVHVGKTISILNVVKETHQALNENRPDFYAIPREQELVAQEMLLFENSGSDDLEDLVDSQFSQTHMTMKMPFADATLYTPVLRRIETRAGEIMGDGIEVSLTGEGILMTTVTEMLASTLIKTYVVAFAIITPLMMLLLGNPFLGLISMIPNLMPIIMTLGLMGWLGIPLEIFTLLIGSIALGLAVDDTIHFMHNFRRHFERNGDVQGAVRETLGTTGQALLFTSIVLSSGFFSYMLATMKNLFYFGFLTGVTIILAFLADLILAPALMSLLAERVARQPHPIAKPESA